MFMRSLLRALLLLVSTFFFAECSSAQFSSVSDQEADVVAAEAQLFSSKIIKGNEFRLDGILLLPEQLGASFLEIDVPEGSVLSGVSKDGTPFAVSSFERDSIVYRTVKLEFVDLPAKGDSVTVLPNDPTPLGIRTGQTLVVDNGGVLGDHFGAGRGSNTVVTSGEVGQDFEVVDGRVTVIGGRVGNHFGAFGDSTVDISGGTFGEFFSVYQSTLLNLSGGELRLNGIDITGLSVPGDTVALDLSENDVLSGTFTDGTPFAFSPADGDFFADGSLSLAAAVVPAVEPANFVLPSDPAPSGLRDGQVLTLSEGGILDDDFNAGYGSVVNILGGQVGHNFEAVGAEVEVSGGSFGNGFDAFHDSEVNITNGYFGHGFSAKTGSSVDIASGYFEAGFNVEPGSEVKISGGSYGDHFEVLPGSSVHLVGSEFRLDDVLIPNLSNRDDSVVFDIPDGSVLSGTFADGTPFAFSNGNYGDSIANGTLTLTAATLPDVGPPLIVLPGDKIPLGIRSGQTLVLDDNAVLPRNFNVGKGSTLIVVGGLVDYNLDAVGAHVVITNGKVEFEFDAFAGTTVDISGGRVNRLVAHDEAIVNVTGGDTYVSGFSGSTVNMSSGYLNASLRNGTLNISGGDTRLSAFNNSTINFSDGTISDKLRLGSDSIMNITGGTISGSFNVENGSTVNLSGGVIKRSVSYFELNSESILNMSGGTIESFVDAEESLLNITGGTFLELVHTSNSVVNFTGATAKTLTANDGTIANIYGGTIEDNFVALNGGQTHISAGKFEGSVSIRAEGTMNFAGGTFGEESYFDVREDGTLNLFGTQFMLDGVDITSMLTVDEPFAITDRDVELAGKLVDGSHFDYYLDSTYVHREENADINANINVILVEPGVFDFEFMTLQKGFGKGYDGSDLLDWQRNFGAPVSTQSAGIAAIPEPSSMFLLLGGLALVGLTASRKRVLQC